MTNVVPTPGSVSTSTVPPRSSTAVRTTSRPTPRPEVSVTSSRVEKPGTNSSRQQRRAGQRSRRRRAAPRAIAGGAQRVLVDAGAVVGDLDDDGRAGGPGRRRVTVGRAGLAGGRALAPAVSQPWSTALVTRCLSASATPSSTRVSSSTSSPSRTQPDVLAVAAATSRTSCGKLATTRRTGTIARPIAPSRTGASWPGRPRSGRAGRGRRPAAGRPARASACTRVGDLGGDAAVAVQHGLAQRRASTSACSAAMARDPAGRALDAPGLELGLADDVEQVVHASGRAPGPVSPRRPCGSAGVGGVRRRRPRRPGAAACGTSTGSSPPSARSSAATSAARSSADTGRSAPGIARPMPSRGGEQQVDEVAADGRTGRRAARRAGPRQRCASADDVVQRRARGPSP